MCVVPAEGSLVLSHDGIPWVIIINHNVRPFSRPTFGEIEPLTRYVAPPVAVPHLFDTAKQIRVAPLGPGESSLEGGLDKDGEIPVPNQFRTEQKDAVEKKHGVSFRRPDRESDF
jgi:hypothetical protein